MSPVCRNCGEPAGPNYCPQCGQAVEDRRAPLAALLGDFFTEFLSLNGRHLRTARQLLIPGRLTQLYLEGKRASYVSPVRVYFVASLLFFLLVGFPAPDARNYNVMVGDVLLDRDEPDPALTRMTLTFGESSWLGRAAEPYLSAKRERLTAMSAQDLLDGLFAGLERTLPAALILYVPVLALALKVTNVRRPFFYVDHLVFALHYQSALFLALILARFANSAGLGNIFPAIGTYLITFLVVGPAYLLLALKRVYEQSWPRTILKGLALVVLYLVLIRPVVFATFLLAIRDV